MSRLDTITCPPVEPGRYFGEISSINQDGSLGENPHSWLLLARYERWLAHGWPRWLHWASRPSFRSVGRSSNQAISSRTNQKQVPTAEKRAPRPVCLVDTAIVFFGFFRAPSTAPSTLGGNTCTDPPVGLQASQDGLLVLNN